MNIIAPLLDKTIGRIQQRYIGKSQNLIINKTISAAYYDYLLTNLSDGKVLPYNVMSISPPAMMLIVNHILIHDIKYILEFGTGISTIFLNNLSKANDLHLRIVSIDHDLDWQKTISERYRLDHVEFVHSPLKSGMKFKQHDYNWYDLSSLTAIDKTKVELVIVDGPIGIESVYERAGAFEFLRTELSRQNFSLLLDDTNFAHFKEIMDFYCPDARNYLEYSTYGKGFKYYVDPVLSNK